MDPLSQECTFHSGKFNQSPSFLFHSTQGIKMSTFWLLKAQFDATESAEGPVDIFRLRMSTVIREKVFLAFVTNCSISMSKLKFIWEVTKNEKR